MKKATTFLALLGIISLFSSCPTPETVTAERHIISIETSGAETSEIISANFEDAVRGTTVTLTASPGTDRLVLLSSPNSTIVFSYNQIFKDGGSVTFRMPDEDVVINAVFCDPDFKAEDFIHFPVGSGIKYRVTDEYEDLDEEVWVVSQELPEGNLYNTEVILSLIQIYLDQMNYRSSVSSVIGAKHFNPTSTFECFGFTSGMPVGNQANFYRLFFQLKKLMILGERYENTYLHSTYTVADGGSVTINGTTFENCLRINLVVDDPDSAYLSGSGYAIFAPGTGLIKLEFTRAAGSEDYSGKKVTYEYLEQATFEAHSVSGTVTTDGSDPASDYYVQISTSILDSTSKTDEDGKFTLENIYGPDINLYISLQDGESLEWDTIKETQIYNVTENVTGLNINLSEL